MPRRATLTYTSEDARARGVDGAPVAASGVRVYYCRSTGAAALATDADLAALPTRRTDGAAILDTTACTLRLYAEPGGTVVLRRRGYGGEADSVEVQVRLAVGGVPVAYRVPPPPPSGGGSKKDVSRFLYILPDALSPHLPGTGGDGGPGDDDGVDGGRPPPAVALKLRGGGCQLAARLRWNKEDGGDKAHIVTINAERVGVSLPASLAADEAGARSAVADALTAALDVRRSAVAVQAGPPGDAASRIVLVTGVPPWEAFEKLVALVEAGAARE
jgi:hypothetical protein